MVSIQRWTVAGRVFMCAWVLFTVPTEVSILSTGLNPTTLLLVAAFVAWNAVWVWFWARALGRSRRAEMLGFAANLAILPVFTLIAPSPIGVGGVLVFAFVIAGVSFPLRQAGWVLAALLVMQLALMNLRLEDLGTQVSSLINNLLVGVVAMGARLLWQSYRELLAAREEIARLAVSEERLRFARDVHDLLGQSLAMIVLKSELVARQLPAAADDSLRHELQDIVRAGRKSLNDLRDAVSGYRKPTLAGEISSARTALRSAGIAFQVDDRLGPVAPEQEAVLAWCLREAVTNVVKHSGARKCALGLSRDDGMAHLHITDDGRGATSLDGGTGLIGLRERVEVVGGTLEVGSEEGGGLRLSVVVPAGAPAQAELAAS